MTKHDFFTSKEVKSILKIKDCDLAHIRNAGKLLFIKKKEMLSCIQKNQLTNLKRRTSKWRKPLHKKIHS